MIALSFAAWFVLTWAVWAPASLGRHLAEIADAFEQQRTRLRTERETAA